MSVSNGWGAKPRPRQRAPALRTASSWGATLTFRDARNWCQVRVFTLEFVEIKSGHVRRPSPWMTMTGRTPRCTSALAMRCHRERSDVAPQQPCRARQRKKPGVRQPQRAAHSRRQAWQRPYPQPHCAFWISPPSAAKTAGIGDCGAAALAAGARVAAASTRPAASDSFVNMQVCSMALSFQTRS